MGAGIMVVSLFGGPRGVILAAAWRRRYLN